MHANGKRQRPEVMRDIKWNKGDKGREKGQKRTQAGNKREIKETASSKNKKNQDHCKGRAAYRYNREGFGKSCLALSSLRRHVTYTGERASKPTKQPGLWSGQERKENQRVSSRINLQNLASALLNLLAGAGASTS